MSKIKNKTDSHCDAEKNLHGELVSMTKDN